jgi:4-amino-4-deoxy-L-arabinose transferase-like glycosyltransferase
VNRSVGRWALLLACLLFAVAGQLYFAKRPEYFWDAVLFYAVAAVCLVVLARPAAPVEDAAPAVRRSREDWLRISLAALGLIFGAVAVLQLRSPQLTYWPIFWTWIAGVVLCLAATLPPPAEGIRRFRKSLSAMGWEPLVVFALFILALALRAWRVDAIPSTLSGDEGNFGRWAREALDGRLVNMFSTGHLSMPSLYAFFQAAWLRLAGDNMLGLRLPWAIIGTLSALGTYLLVRRLFGRWLAILTTLLVAGYSYHIHYSRLGLNNIADPFFVVWALYFFVMGWQRSLDKTSGHQWPWAVAGLLSGIAFYFYTGGRQVPVILLGVIVWAALTEREFLARSRAGLVALALAFVILIGPMALYATQHPDDFNARMNQVGILQTGWLAREAQARTVSELVVLAEQFRRVFFAFSHFLDRTDFFRPSRPLLDFPASILFLLGVVLSVTRLIDRRARGVPGMEHPQRGDEAGQRVEPEDVKPARPSWRYAVFVVWFFGVIIAGGVLTDNAPSSQRIVSSSIPAMFFVAVALREFARIFASLTGLPKAGRRALELAVAAALVFSSASYYFGPYQESRVYGSFNGEVSTAIGHYMQRLGPDWKQYFFGAPRMWAEFGSATFISKNPYFDAVDPLSSPPTFVDPAYNAAFIILPERIGDLDFVRQAYPNGQLEEVHRDGEADAPLLFTAYTVVIK